ncbi:hypothetical protein Efla_001747 [Eimeria flavescens]
MKTHVVILQFIACSNAAALVHKARHKSFLSPFAFVPPEVEEPVSHFAPSRPYKKGVPAPEDIESLRSNVVTQVNAVQEELEEELGGTPTVEQPEKEKEEKARSKSNFLTQLIEEASKIFSGGSSEPLTGSDIQDLEKCPEGFTEHATDCVAPPNYEGPCSKRQPELYLLSSTAKASWSLTCKATYPCMPKKCPGGTDYSQPCPIGWFAGLSGKCITDDATSRCDKQIIASADKTAKASWETACGVLWPCRKKSCVKDFSVICPAGWAHVGYALCKAPATYQGPCSRQIDLSAYKGRSDLKRALEMRCGVTWLCKSSTYERDRDYSVPCPLGWEQTEDSSCQAPASYTPPSECPRTVTFVGRPASDRQSFAALCGVDFPFRGNCFTCRSADSAVTIQQRQGFLRARVRLCMPSGMGGYWDWRLLSGPSELRWIM